ncbi:hypothetical protein [Amycolatopsis anabasis]|uniref:hypothetical protein n=1 Tax=Amycolatopsis anabasis TaxID=1840409 RepID=UPI001FE39B7E|nr:hypothetical protein [Amycolatopsis anabasis]
MSWGVVHASFDFEREKPVTTVEVLMRLAYDLSRKWRHRAKPRFIRFTIALIAVQVGLDGTNREKDKETLRDLLNNLRRGHWQNEIDNLADLLAGTAQAADLLHPPFTELFTKVFPQLIRTIRPRLGKAMRSLADFPQAEGASPLDALVNLNRLAHEEPTDVKAVTAWLTAAFLTDVRENHRAMSAPEPRSPCDCVNPGKVRHLHNWVLLLDNVDHPGGAEFLADLTDARNRYRRQHPDEREASDALLVIATSGRWLKEWESPWRPPWQPDPAAPDRLRSVPPCHAASYDHWAEGPANSRPSPYYPVTLDPLRIEEIAEVLDTTSSAAKAAFVQQATGGLPAAVRHVRQLLRERPVQHGARNMLGGDDATDDPWHSRLRRLRLADHLPDVSVDDFVTAAPFATAPWLIPLSAMNRISQPHVGRILTELRTALWVTARSAAGATADQVILHPWVATNLVSALARRGNNPHPSYADQFAALRDDPDTDQDPVRRAYCQLALGDLGSVVTLFEEEFDRRRHQEWVDRLRLVVHAPDQLPLEENYDRLYDELVNRDLAQNPEGRTEIRNNLARLVAASWLAANPFAVRGRNQDQEVANAFESLARISQLPDVAALYDAARGQWP